MENEILKDEAGDIIHNVDGDPQSNMIGALTSFIQNIGVEENLKLPISMG